MVKFLKQQTRKSLTNRAGLYLCLLFVSMGTLVQAQILSYGLKIGGKEVTSANYTNISAAGGFTAVKSGKVTYHHATKTLTLDNAKLNCPGNDYCIENYEIDGLKIHAIGIVRLEKTGNLASLKVQKNTEIDGDGYGDITANKFIYVRNCDLKIKDCTVKVADSEYGIAGESGSEDLTIENATVKATGAAEGSIMDIASLNLIGRSIITSPTLAKFDASKHAVVDANGNIVKEQVVIQPVSNYGLQIAGVEVHTENFQDLSVIPGVSGTVKYDPGSETLTLDNAKIECSTTNCIHNESKDDLKIKLIGTNELKGSSSSSSALLSRKDFTIFGGGTLNATHTTGESSGIGVWKDRTLTIANCTVNAKGEYGIYGAGGAINLVINNAPVKAKGKDKPSFYKIKKMTLQGGCAIKTPKGAKFDASQKTVVDKDGNAVKTEVLIEPAKYYGLKIAGKSVTDVNVDSIILFPGVSGSVTYSPSSKTLTLDNAKIETSTFNCIRNESIDGLQIKLIGTNELQENGNNSWYSLKSQRDMTITGDGTLNASHTNTTAIGVADGHTLTIANCTVNASGKEVGFEAYGIGKLVIENATVKATGKDKSSFLGIKELTLTDCKIESPAGAKFDASKKSVVDATSGEPVKEEVVITPTRYGLKIAGVWVTEENCNDLRTIAGVSGTALQYDHATKTLTLDNAKIESSTVNCIRNESIDGLQIVLAGTNELQESGNNSWFSLKSQRDMTITGGGTLNASHINTAAIGVADGHTLTIANCTVNASGKEGGFEAYGIGKLVIDKATVKATGKDESSFHGVKELSLVDCEITTPAGAVFDASKQSVVDASGNPINEEVVIEPTSTTGIQDLNASAVSLYPNPAEGQFFVEVPASGKLEIINLAGQKVQEFALKAGKNEIRMNQSGMYFIYLTGKDYRTVKKLIVK